MLWWFLFGVCDYVIEEVDRQIEDRGIGGCYKGEASHRYKKEIVRYRYICNETARHLSLTTQVRTGLLLDETTTVPSFFARLASGNFIACYARGSQHTEDVDA